MRKIARGGMAELWDDGSLIYKRLRPIHAHDPSAMWMLREEGRLLSRLQHPGILKIVEVRDTELVLERIDGVDADVGFRWGRDRAAQPDNAALAVAAQVADALNYIASRGLIHRDINPPNIVLERTTGRAVLIDFGVARDATREGRTATGVVKGKVAYLAPEQARGGVVSPATDVYALGATLHALLTGASPITDWIAMAERVTSDTLPLDPTLEPNVAAWIERMMALEPASRPSAAELAALWQPYSSIAIGEWVDEITTLANRLDRA